MIVQLRWCATNTPCVDEVMDLDALPRFGDAVDDSTGKTFIVVDTHWFPSDESCGVMLILHSLDRARAMEARTGSPSPSPHGRDETEARGCSCPSAGKLHGPGCELGVSP